MTSQQALFAETIAGMKRARKRREEDWDSDSSLEHLTNRGNKLRKKARFVREGQLGAPTGPEAYKSRIEHAGFRREIISKKPALVDEDGDTIDSEDDDERVQTAAHKAAEFDPYAGVRIEYILAPLTAASDLPHHPTLSRPFTNKTLTELARHAGEILHKERASLWRIKHLLTRLSGDDIWIPCGLVESENDVSYFTEQPDQYLGSTETKQNMEANREATSGEQAKGTETNKPEQSTVLETAVNYNSGGGDRKDESVLRIEPAGAEISTTTTESSKKNATKDGPSLNGIGVDPKSQENTQNDVMMDVDDSNPAETLTLKPPLDISSAEVNEVADGDILMEEAEEAAVPRRMRTRAQAQAASENVDPVRMLSASPEFDEDLLVHPFFLAPKASHPDRDMGLPQHEAEETRRLLQLYVQKQEEICRSAQKVYEGLLRADRLRHTVMKWAKAEAHVGINRDMSDGEDWYDKEEWGLEEDLKKGQDEDEEDATTTAKKTTRARRQ